jgi:hypothetical protein
VFVLWPEGVPEGSDQTTSANGLLPVKIFIGARGFPMKVIRSSITETESREICLSNAFWLKG